MSISSLKSTAFNQFYNKIIKKFQNRNSHFQLNSDIDDSLLKQLDKELELEPGGEITISETNSRIID